ncbi:hypothetical protein Tco_0831701 [Tanacetum coccineum]
MAASPRGKPKKKSLRTKNKALHKSPLKKQKKNDEDERLLLIFKQIHINLPFLKAMIHMPKGAKEEEEDPSNALAVSFYPRTESVEPLEWKDPKNRLKPSSMEPPKLELKELPEHLEHAFLQENNQLPVVISSVLSTDEKTRLLKVVPKKGRMTVDTREDQATVRAEIEILRRERLAYEQESIETRQALARSEAYSRALEARIRVLETQAYRHEWQRQDADDRVIKHIMHTQAFEAGVYVDTLEDTGSSA